MLVVEDESALAELLAMALSLAEVVLRLRTLLRHGGMDVASPGPPLVIGDLILDEGHHEVTRGGRRIDLTTVEFELLRLLMRNAGQVLTSAQIARSCRRASVGSMPLSSADPRTGLDHSCIGASCSADIRVCCGGETVDRG